MTTKIKTYQIDNDGWTPYLGTMPVFVSTTNGVDTLTLTDADDFLQKGAKVEITSGAGTHTYYVSDADATGFDVAGETSVSGTITAMRYSYADCPFGFKKCEDWYRAKGHTTQTIANITSTDITSMTEDYDDNNNLASGTWTAPITGSYRVSSSYIVDDVGIDKRIILDIIVPGASMYGFGVAVTSVHDPSANVSGEVFFNRGETANMRVYQDSGSSKATNAKSFMSIQFTAI